ncbi:hypothetical protein [Longimicrobium sp.]|uniref:hypothetical protein n=1 Tax=Longimicrobium sp. TaxID=2029185 RepID=UPI002C77712B|nr:hypothetical protein [Longimicrobium sp.]HSU12915.1 hypothetical protein [Longimicrobium sp.]
MPAVLEQLLGAVVMAVVLADVFLSVLYARMGSSILGRWVAFATWKGFRLLRRVLGRRAVGLLSFIGPVIIVLLIGTWAFGLGLGAALAIHPALGTGVVTMAGPTPTGFATALLAGVGSISVVSEGGFAPHTTGYRLFFAFGGVVGTSVVSLTLAYLMQVYTALRSRNVLGLKIHLLSGQTADAAELLAGLGSGGDFSSGYTVLNEMAVEVSATKEGHHFYPVLFYFRFTEPLYAISRITLMSLDSVSLIKSALHDEEYGRLKESGPVEQLWRGAIILAGSLEDTFLRGGSPDGAASPDAATRERWERRYAAAVRRLRQAGIRTMEDERDGAGRYVALRACWDRHVTLLAPAMMFELQDIDPAGADPEASDRRPPFRGRRSAPA